ASAAAVRPDYPEYFSRWSKAIGLALPMEEQLQCRKSWIGIELAMIEPAPKPDLAPTKRKSADCSQETSWRRLYWRLQQNPRWVRNPPRRNMCASCPPSAP